MYNNNIIYSNPRTPHYDHSFYDYNQDDIPSMNTGAFNQRIDEETRIRRNRIDTSQQKRRDDIFAAKKRAQKIQDEEDEKWRVKIETFIESLGPLSPQKEHELKVQHGLILE